MRWTWHCLLAVTTEQGQARWVMLTAVQASGGLFGTAALLVIGKCGLEMSENSWDRELCSSAVQGQASSRHRAVQGQASNRQFLHQPHQCKHETFRSEVLPWKENTDTLGICRERSEILSSGLGAVEEKPPVPVTRAQQQGGYSTVPFSVVLQWRKN